MAISQDQRLRIDLSKYEKLNREQAGHLRHFHNLVDQIDGEWYGMGSQQDAHQEFLDAYRYQLAQMSYGAAVAHYHRLPAARSIFKPLLRRIIHKMLRPEVWGYWYLTSQSGKLVDPDITELRKPWADPVATENIMYSGHLLLMTSLYAMLFDDDEFEKPGSITFTWAPIFWGFGPETYRYDNRSLQTVIVEQMEHNNWVGVCCEPNSVFVVCNQFPIIAMRYNDVRDGVDTVSHILEKYKKAIADHGLLRLDGLYAEWLYLKQGRVEPPKGVTSVAWANAFMNSWNTDFVYSSYDRQALGFIMSINGEFRLQDPAVALEYRKLAQTEKPAECDETAMLEKARVEAAKLPPNPFPLTAPYLGYVVQWLSELGKEKELEDLLEYADSRLLPTWERGGLFYPRNNTTVNGNGDWVHMDPFTGNAAIGYARLNVKDGQRIMWEKPWTQETLASRPWIDEVSLSQGVDCLRACWDDEEKLLVLTLRAWDNGSVKVQPVARNLSAGSWGVYVQGKLIQQDVVEDGGSLSVDVGVSNEDLDIVFLKI
ncbi:Linalool dehydratase/isomerase [Colletotrichum higginsianum]|uniref:Linalool dehydratase/isomerase n=1 Tax=Colletotrichum higginsianum TaxID=80884 RepID=A0A4T0WFV0_9PEZI|nr:Linalool dehydratase/isomerase [Colletotrichum higginsianum]